MYWEIYGMVVWAHLLLFMQLKYFVFFANHNMSPKFDMPAYTRYWLFCCDLIFDFQDI